MPTNIVAFILASPVILTSAQRHIFHDREGGGSVPKQSQGWTERVAIYNTTKAKDAQMAEKALTKFLRSSPINAYKCLNKTMGGELIDQYHHYYIYLLLGPASVRHAYWT